MSYSVEDDIFDTLESELVNYSKFCHVLCIVEILIQEPTLKMYFIENLNCSNNLNLTQE